jgi:hypothetical protein
MEYNVEQELRIKSAVAQYAITNMTLIPIGVMSNPESMQHITNIGAAIMMNKWEINTNPGSFVTAILENDLEGAVNNADSINRDMLPFYVTLKYNMGYVS